MVSSTIRVMCAESDEVTTADTGSASLGNASLLIGRG